MADIQNDAEKDTTQVFIIDTEKQISSNRLCSKLGINKDLILLKITFFMMYGATAALLPYLTIHMQSIGLTVEETAIIYLALLFTTFLSPAITGFLVDKFGKYKPVLVISLLLNAVCHHSLYLIPHRELPGEVPAAFAIRKFDLIELWWSPCSNRACPDDSQLTIALRNCMNFCQHWNGTDWIHDIEGRVIEPKNNKVFTLKVDKYAYLDKPRPEGIPGAKKDVDDWNTHKIMHFRTVSGDYYEPTELYTIDLRCGAVVYPKSWLHENMLGNPCPIKKCEFVRGGPEICPSEFHKAEKWVFWVYFLIRFLALTMLSACITIMDPIALTLIERYGGDFGRQRMFSILGMTIAAPVTGALVDYFSRGLDYTDYGVVFYTYDILLAVSIVAVFIMPLDAKLPVENVAGNFRRMLQRPHIIIFLFFIFIMGCYFGFTESFQFLYLKSLGAPNYLLGIVIGAGTLSGVPFLYGAEKITAQFGHIALIVVAFFSHATRLIGYSFLKKAWWCFPLEATEGLSVHLMWVAAATYCAILAPQGLTASLIGVMGTGHFSLGRGCGSFIGGMLMGAFGARSTFRYMGLSAIVAGIAYALLYKFWLRGYTRRALDIKAKEEEEEGGEDTLLSESGQKRRSIELNQKTTI